MSFWDKLRALSGAPKDTNNEINIKTHNMIVGESIRTERILARMWRLYCWLESEKAKKNPVKVAEIRAELQRSAYTLAGRGFPLVESKAEVEELLDLNEIDLADRAYKRN